MVILKCPWRSREKGVSLRAEEASGGGNSPRQETKTQAGGPEKSKTPHVSAQTLEAQVQPANTGVQSLVSHRHHAPERCPWSPDNLWTLDDPVRSGNAAASLLFLGPGISRSAHSVYGTIYAEPWGGGENGWWWWCVWTETVPCPNHTVKSFLSYSLIGLARVKTIKSGKMWTNFRLL